MIIYDFITSMPVAMASVFLKSVREKIDDECKQQILEHGLYHVTSNPETAEKIVKSQHLRPATGLFKNANSYGIACAYMFNGPPSIENYIKNVMGGRKDNPYTNPTIVRSAVKITPRKKEELANYKVRPLEDKAILFEGYCVIPQEEIEAVFIVPDLKRDLETGEPIINPETGRYEICFREAMEEELSEDGKSYIAKEDYLQFMEEEKSRLGYMKGNNIIANSFNEMYALIHGVRIHRDGLKKNFFKDTAQMIKRQFKRITTPKLDMGIDEKIQHTIREFDTSKKNPYRDRKFGEAVAEFQTQGLQQLELKEVLEEMTTSDTGKFFRQKFKQIDKTPIIQKGLHGIEHNNRVAIHAMLIAQNEGLLEGDIDNRTKDILLTAAYYHDIGRKKGIITDNYGPHAKNSARKVKKMELTYADGTEYTPEDKKILQAVIEAHEAKDKDMAKICKKYKISEQDMQYTMQLIAILKDADALDRTRLDINLPINVTTDLNPQYLRTDTSKRLLNASYQLETLSQKVEFDRIIAYKTQDQQEGGIKETRREQFVDYLREGVSQVPAIAEKVITGFKLPQKGDAEKFTGHIIDKVKELIKNKSKSNKTRESNEEVR